MKKVIPECKNCGYRSFFVKWVNTASIHINNPKGTWEDQNVVLYEPEGLLDRSESEVVCQKCKTRVQDDDMLFVLDFILENHLEGEETVTGNRPGLIRAWSKKPICEFDRVK